MLVQLPPEETGVQYGGPKPQNPLLPLQQAPYGPIYDSMDSTTDHPLTLEHGMVDVHEPTGSDVALFSGLVTDD